VSLVIFNNKPQDDTRLVTVDFVGRIPPGDYITSVSTWIEMADGVDFTPQALLKGAPVFDGTEVSQMITAGIIGNIYRLSFIANTARGQSLQLSGFIVVHPDVIGETGYLSLPLSLPVPC
jgi:hypothetical protein